LWCIDLEDTIVLRHEDRRDSIHSEWLTTVSSCELFPVDH